MKSPIVMVAVICCLSFTPWVYLARTMWFTGNLQSAGVLLVPDPQVPPQISVALQQMANQNPLSGLPVEPVLPQEDVRAESANQVITSWNSLGKTINETVAELDAQSRTDLEQTVNSSSRSLGNRFRDAAKLFARHEALASKEALRNAVRQWLREALNPKPVPDIPRSFREVRGAGFGNIILGIFEPAPGDPLGYLYFSKTEDHVKYQEWVKLGSVGLAPVSQVKVTRDVKSTALQHRISKEPDLPSCVKAVNGFNGKIRELRADSMLASKAAWQDIAVLCRRLDDIIDRDRKLAEVTEPPKSSVDDQEFARQKYAGVFPKIYATAYRDLRFLPEAEIADEIVSHFELISSILGE